MASPAAFTPQTPVPLDPPPALLSAEQLAENNAGYFGIFVYKGNLYSMTAQGSTGTLQIFQSTDAGKTWHTLDASHAPTSNSTNGSAYVSVASGLVIVAYPVTGTSPTNVALAEFNLATGLWSTPAQSGTVPTAYKVRTIYIRPDGTYVVLYDREPHPADSGLYANFFASGSWQGEIDYATNITTLSGYNPATVDINNPDVMSCMGSDGSIYTFFSMGDFLSPSGWNNRIFYQRISPANTVAGTPGDFEDFAGQSLTPQTIAGQGIGKPCIAAGQLILPVSRNFPPATTPEQVPAFYVGQLGSGVTVTSWALTSQTIDPATLKQYPITSCTQPGPAIYDGTYLYVAYLSGGKNNQSDGAIRLCWAPFAAGANANALSWSALMAYDSTDATQFTNPNSITVLSFPSIQAINGFILLQSDADSFSPVTFYAAFFFGTYAIYPPARITFRGVKRTRICEDAPRQLAVKSQIPHVDKAV